MSRTDCLVIPSIGALLALYHEAMVGPDIQYYMPPKRTFAFNSDLRDSDGALAYSISKAEKITISEATKIVKDETEAMSRQLSAEGQLSLGRIGNLRIDAESGKTLFTSFGDNNMSVATAFLPRVASLSVEAEKAEPAHGRHIQYRVSPWKKAVRIAASIALLITIGFVASTPIAVDDVTLASLCPQIEKLEMEEVLPMPAPEPLALRIVNTEADRVLSVGESARPAVANFDGPYVIVLASFSTKEDAERHIAKHAASEMRILEKNGRFRIYSQSFATEQEAYATLESESVSDAWVCKR